MTSAPTPAELTRATELAPRVAASIPKAAFQGSDGLWFYQDNEAADLLSANTFQRVLLALPEELYIAAIDLAARECDTGSRAFFRWLLTAAGMLAFYEALVAQADQRDNDPTTEPLIGATVLGVCDEYNNCYIKVRLANGAEQYLCASQDDEGNGAGTFFMEDEPIDWSDC